MKLRDWINICLLASVLLGASCSADRLTDGPRDQLTYEDLMLGTIPPKSPIDNRYFLPVGESAPARHTFEGTIQISSNALKIKSYMGDSYPVGFPVIKMSFFTYGDDLVPVDRSVIKGKYGQWGVVIEPGKVWSEPADEGMSRASFPFILLRPDPNYPWFHNGIATFLYDDSQVSSLFIQIVQEVNVDLVFDMWGMVPGKYGPEILPDKQGVEAEFVQELSQQVDFHAWDELEDQYGAKITRTFNRGIKREEDSASGLIIDGVVYLQAPMTRYGEYPFPRYMRSHVYSVSKSVGNGMAMLRLAQKYGDQVFDLKISDYLDVTAGHPGWDEVTFGDVLNMAVGVGNGSHERYPLDIYGDDVPENKAFWLAQTTDQKLEVTFSSDNHPWGPGEVARYINAHAFVLSAAMDSYLESHEGPDVQLWDFLTKEIYEPIGIQHLPMLHTMERDGTTGTPMMVCGLYPTVDAIAKISILLQNGGRYKGEQLLSSSMLQRALYQTDISGFPTGNHINDSDQSYLMSFWGHPYRTSENKYLQIPYMTGNGGSTVILCPNGITLFRFTDAKNYDVESLISVAEMIRPFSGGQDEPIILDTAVDK